MRERELRGPRPSMGGESVAPRVSTVGIDAEATPKSYPRSFTRPKSRTHPRCDTPSSHARISLQTATVPPSPAGRLLHHHPPRGAPVRPSHVHVRAVQGALAELARPRGAAGDVQRQGAWMRMQLERISADRYADTDGCVMSTESLRLCSSLLAGLGRLPSVGPKIISKSSPNHFLIISALLPRCLSNPPRRRRKKRCRRTSCGKRSG